MSGESVSVVIPVFNEEGSLETLYGGIRDSLSSQSRPWDVVFVDDGSTDRSSAILRTLQASEPERISVVRLRGRFGKSAALLAGFRHARGTLVATMDADGQDDPAELPAMIAKLDEGYDLVCAWRKERHDPWLKRNSSLLFNAATSILTGIGLNDHNSGFKVYRAAALAELDLYGELHRFIPALLGRRGFRCGEIPVRHHPRKTGVTKYGPERFINGMLDLLTVVFLANYLRTPLHLFGRLGLVFIGFGVAIDVYLSYIKLSQGVIFPHYPLLFVGVLLVIVGVQFVCTGLMGELIVKSNLKDSDRFAVAETLIAPGSAADRRRQEPGA